MNKVDDFVSRWGTQKYLAFSLFCYLIADAFTPDNLILLYSIMAMLIVSGPMATGRNGRERLLTIVLSLVMIGLGYAAIFTGDTETRFAAHIIAALFLAT